MFLQILLGPSGSGKSTLLNIIGGIDSADEGNLVIDGERLADMSEKNLSLYRRKHLGYIFQMYNLIPNLTVRENIEVGAYLSDKPLDVDELLHTLGIYEHQTKITSMSIRSRQQSLTGKEAYDEKSFTQTSAQRTEGRTGQVSGCIYPDGCIHWICVRLSGCR